MPDREEGSSGGQVDLSGSLAPLDFAQSRSFANANKIVGDEVVGN